MAPEVLRGETDTPSDIFSFGIVLTEVLAAQDAHELNEMTRTPESGLDRTPLHGLIEPVLASLGDGRTALLGWLDLACLCCDLSPSSRPTAAGLLLELESASFGPAPAPAPTMMGNTPTPSNPAIGGVAAAPPGDECT